MSKNQITETIAEAPDLCVRIRRVTYPGQYWRTTTYLVQSRSLVGDSTTSYFSWKPVLKTYDEAEARDMLRQVYEAHINYAAAHAPYHWFREIQNGLYELFEAVGYEGFFQHRQSIDMPLTRREVTKKFYPG